MKTDVSVHAPHAMLIIDIVLHNTSPKHAQRAESVWCAGVPRMYECAGTQSCSARNRDDQAVIEHLFHECSCSCLRLQLYYLVLPQWINVLSPTLPFCVFKPQE